jgi:two-component system cell cycle response regulator DivK
MSKTILIAEDDELNRKLFSDLLTLRGYRTLQTRDGVGALRLAREHRPHLILMNIKLPDMSGLEVTHRIKQDKTLRHIPVIAVTGFAMDGDAEKILASGCDGYMIKPIVVAEYLSVVERALNDSPQAEQ